MKLLRSCTFSNLRCDYKSEARVFRDMLYCTKTLPPSTSKDTLYKRISRAGDPRVSMVGILDQWVEEGRTLDKAELKTIIKLLRKYKRFNHALQVSEWMSDKRYLDLLPEDFAVRLDLISKVHGLEQAEEYFNKIPNTLRILQVYGALLNCYAHAKSLEKAEATMQNMRELGFVRTPLAYNVMLNLYLQMGIHKKLDSLVQEMEDKGIGCDKFTFCIRLNAYAATSDIEGMDKILMKMEADPTVSMDWNAYAVAANGYLKTGLMEKALATLKKSEKLIRVTTRKLAYEHLLTLYARMGNKDEVYRIWNLCKKTVRMYNTTYLCILSSLMKLDDLDGMEKIFEEWEAKRTFFDLRIPNMLISAYCRKGLLGKAESIVNGLIESGKEPNTSTWNRLADGYHKYNNMAKAVDAMKKAIIISCPRWKPSLATLAGCMEYLKGKGDAEIAEFRTLLEEQGHISRDTYERLVNYMENGNPGANALN